MGDEEGKGGAGEMGEAFYLGLDEGGGGDAVDLTGGVYDADFYCSGRGGNLEVWRGLCHFGVGFGNIFLAGGKRYGRMGNISGDVCMHCACIEGHGNRDE